MLRRIKSIPHLYFSKNINMYSTLPVNPLLAVLLSSARGGFTASGVRRIDRRI